MRAHASPHSPSSWGHRKYVLQQIVKDLVKASDDYESKLVDLVNKEIALCSKIAEKFPKNYYAWTHRRYLWSSCILPYLQSNDNEKLVKALLKQEFDALKCWLELHISDHSAVHYLSQVLEIQLQHIPSEDETQSILMEVAQKSLNLAKTLLDTHPNHESLWILRRLMVQLLFQHAQNSSVSSRESIHALLEGLVDEVYTKLHSEHDGYTSHTSVYAWSFLVRCMSQLGLGGHERQKKLLDGLSFLQSDSHVYHKMWKTQGQEILLLGEK